MSRNSMDALFGMMSQALLDKEQEENKKVLDALDHIDLYGQLAQARSLRSRTHTDFGVEYDIPFNWTRLHDKEPDSVMYYAKGSDARHSFMPAAIRITRRRGDYRGYENLDRLERLATYAAKTSGVYDFKHLEDVTVGGRKGVKAVCEDNSSPGESYDTDIYFFYKSKTEVMVFFCITARQSRPYYRRVFNKILSSIRYIR